MKAHHKIILGLMFAAWTGIAFGQYLYIYPSEGRSKEQQEADEFQCYRWARDESGFGQMATPVQAEHFEEIDGRIVTQGYEMYDFVGRFH
jgi:hypothetical protein